MSPPAPRAGPRARGALLLAAACALALAASTAGTRDDAFAPNNWLFAHVFLAQQGIAEGALPLNGAVLSENSFGATKERFRADTGLGTLTLYATTVWHFWNGIVLHPALLAGLAAGTGLAPEQAARLPLAMLAAVLLAAASAPLVLRGAARGPEGLAAAGPLLAGVASAPLALEGRVLMPSATLVLALWLLHMGLRRAVLGDRSALLLGMAPLALLPFWYYTMAYFVVALLAGFVLFNGLARWRRWAVPRAAQVPTAAAVLMALFLVAVLVMNGALTSQLRMAAAMPGSPLAGPDTPADLGLDYGSHLNREPWRSALLYAQLGALFAPLGLLAARAAARLRAGRALGPAEAVLVQWALGGALFSGALLGMVNASFLNRGAIYLAPAALLALLMLAAEAWPRRAARASLAAAAAVMLVATPAIVLSAGPAYVPGDAAALDWMAGRVPREAAVYSSMEAASVLFRVHGFHEATAFHPTAATLERFWYSADEEELPAYLASLDYVVLRRDMMTHGFEDFSPSRRPLPPEAHAKFARSPDLHRVFDNGDAQVYLVALDPARYGPRPSQGP